MKRDGDGDRDLFQLSSYIIVVVLFCEQSLPCGIE